MTLKVTVYFGKHLLFLRFVWSYREKIKDKIFPVYYIKWYSSSRDTVPFILNLSTKLRLSGLFHAPTAFPREKNPCTCWQRGLTWSCDCNSTVIYFPWSGIYKTTCMVLPTCWYLFHVITTYLHWLSFGDRKILSLLELQIIFIICRGYVDKSFKKYDRAHSSLYVYNNTYNSEVIFPPKKDGFLFQYHKNLYTL